VPTAVHLSPANAAYLSAKARHGHHGLEGVHPSGVVAPFSADVG
jgi:hypothetical protein